MVETSLHIDPILKSVVVELVDGLLIQALELQTKGCKINPMKSTFDEKLTKGFYRNYRVPHLGF